MFNDDHDEPSSLHEVSILDDNYLQHWESSVGAVMMPSLIADLMETFESSYTEYSQQLQEICRQQKAKHLIKLLHHIKGSLGNMGLSRASAFTRQAEIELRSGRFNRYDTLPEKLEGYVAEGLSALRQRYK